jgi:hypothetical protein
MRSRPRRPSPARWRRRRVGDPDLVLARVAALGVHLVEGREAGLLEPQARGEHLVRRRHLDAAVVESAQVVAALALDQSEHDRRVAGLELRVARLDLRRLGVQEGAVERDRLLHVGNGQGEVWLHLSHVLNSFIDSGIT